MKPVILFVASVAVFLVAQEAGSADVKAIPVPSTVASVVGSMDRGMVTRTTSLQVDPGSYLLALDVSDILKDILQKRAPAPPRSQVSLRGRSAEERRASWLAREIIEGRIPEELRSKYGITDVSYDPRQRGRVIGNDVLELLPFSRARVKLRTYCLDRPLPAPTSGEKLHLIEVHKLLLREFIPIYERLMSYSALHPERSLQIQRIVWVMRFLSEGLDVPAFDLVPEDRNLLEEIYPGSVWVIENQRRRIRLQREISKLVDVLLDQALPPEVRGVLRELSRLGYDINTPPRDLRTADGIVARTLEIINAMRPTGAILEDNSEYTLLSDDIAVKTEHPGGASRTTLVVANPTPEVKTMDFKRYALQSGRDTQRLGIGGIDSVEWPEGRETDSCEEGTFIQPSPDDGGYYGWLGGPNNNHLGHDYNAPLGTEVKAISDGIVYKVIDDASRCYDPNKKDEISQPFVWIRHRLSDGRYFYALYGHIEPSEKVKKGKIKAGEGIGKIKQCYVWYKGELVPAPHLHFGIWDSGSSPPTKKFGYGPIRSFTDPIAFLEKHTPCREPSQAEEKAPIQPLKIEHSLSSRNSKEVVILLKGVNVRQEGDKIKADVVLSNATMTWIYVVQDFTRDKIDQFPVQTEGAYLMGPLYTKKLGTIEFSKGSFLHFNAKTPKGSGHLIGKPEGNVLLGALATDLAMRGFFGKELPPNAFDRPLVLPIEIGIASIDPLFYTVTSHCSGPLGAFGYAVSMKDPDGALNALGSFLLCTTEAPVLRKIQDWLVKFFSKEVATKWAEKFTETIEDFLDLPMRATLMKLLTQHTLAAPPEGWARIDTTETFAKKAPLPQRVRVTAPTAIARMEPNETATPMGTVVKGTVLDVIDQQDGWVQVRLPWGPAGWVHASQVKGITP